MAATVLSEPFYEFFAGWFGAEPCLVYVVVICSCSNTFLIPSSSVVRYY